MRSLNQDPSDEELKGLLQEHDLDGNGTIDLNEFKAMVADRLGDQPASPRPIKTWHMDLQHKMGLIVTTSCVIGDITSSSQAEEVGFKLGSVIVSIGNQPVESLADIKQVIFEAKAKGENTVAICYQEPGNSMIDTARTVKAVKSVHVKFGGSHHHHHQEETSESGEGLDDGEIDEISSLVSKSSLDMNDSNGRKKLSPLSTHATKPLSPNMPASPQISIGGQLSASVAAGSLLARLKNSRQSNEMLRKTAFSRRQSFSVRQMAMSVDMADTEHGGDSKINAGGNISEDHSPVRSSVSPSKEAHRTSMLNMTSKDLRRKLVRILAIFVLFFPPR